MSREADAVRRACDALARHDRKSAASLLVVQIPFRPIRPSRRSTNPDAALRVFLRDGFLDRYSGEQLVFPGVLRLLSHLFPEVVPYHPNGKAGATHPIYWSLQPTLDHVLPLARGGQDEPANLVTTSMLRNAIKGQWTLEELGWELRAPGALAAWDGLMGWFCDHARGTGDGLGVPAVKRWYLAAVRAGGTREQAV